MKLFEYAVIYNPKQTKKQDEEGVQAKSVLVVDVQRILARDAAEVTLIAARQIPEEYLDRLNQVDVVVRPF